MVRRISKRRILTDYGDHIGTKSADLAERHPDLKRFSLQFGYKSVDRVLHGNESSRDLGGLWHDYPNMRWGVGYDIGPPEQPWATVLGSYTTNSMDIDDMKNQFGMGIEVNPVGILAPWIARVPGGRPFLKAHSWFNKRMMIPGLYLQLFEVDTAPFSDREPFWEG